MKKLVAIITMLIMVFGVWFASHYEHHYIRQGEVVQINDGWATIYDTTDNAWDVDAKGLNVGDKVEIIMHDNDTSNNITDDKVMEIRVVE